MATGKKDGGKASSKGQAGGSEKKAKAKAAEETSAKKASEASEAEATSSPGADKHAKEEHGAAGDHAHGHHAPNRKEYMYVFLALFVLTVLEVAVAQVPGISKGMMTLALVGLALTKAAAVGLYYMHLKHETPIMRLTVAIPLATPALYAIVLIAEGAWRLR